MYRKGRAIKALRPISERTKHLIQTEALSSVHQDIFAFDAAHSSAECSTHEQSSRIPQTMQRFSLHSADKVPFLVYPDKELIIILVRNHVEVYHDKTPQLCIYSCYDV